jgi:hypothetical protein
MCLVIMRAVNFAGTGENVALLILSVFLGQSVSWKPFYAATSLYNFRT